MSLYRQLWLAIITSMLLALAGALLASILSARNYLESQLAIKNTDNAAALALSLSHGNPDPISVELAVSALFDSGHYESIRIDDPLGKPIAERSAPRETPDVPHWFVRFLPIEAAPGQAQISDGWKQFGTVTLVSHHRYAYHALWNSVLQMIVALALAGSLGGYLGSLILRRLRAPLNAVISQANAITERRFVTIEEPGVPELRQLSAAMNATVIRLKSMFEEEAARLETVRREANCDALTGLANRSFFMAQLREATHADDASGGTLIIARLAHLATINQSLGRDATDELICRFGKVLDETDDKWPQAVAARLNGADFALLAPGMTDVATTVDALLAALAREASAFLPETETTWLACGRFPRGIDVGKILSQVDGALAAVESEGRNGLRIIDLSEGDDAPKSSEEWTRLIHRALQQRWVRLVSFPVISLDGKLIHRECPLRLMFDEGGEWQPAGRFLPVAERLKLTPQLDLAAIELGLVELSEKPELTGLAINLSASSIQSAAFRLELQALLHRHTANRRLWLEISETGAFAHFEAFRALCLELKDTGCQMGIEHFGRQFSQVGRLHDLGLDYLKIDASFIRGIEANVGNQSFLKGLTTIAHGIDMKVIAEGVASEAERATLAPLGFDGATGPGIRE